MKQYKFYDPKDMKDIAYVKRLMEYRALIPGYGERFNQDPEKILAELGMDYTAHDVLFKPNTVENGDIKMHAKFPGTPAEKYAKFMDNKLKYRNLTRQLCEPDNAAMKKWRARQISRCLVQLGPKSNAIIHAPFSIELSDGCSVGCDFCALASQGLRSVFRYTEENAKLFNEVITIAKEIIGDAAGMGTLYFASEPLDDPDYELFKEDFTKCFGTIPQITTARSTMNIERLRPLLREINENQKIVYRFSLLSEEMTKQVFEAFTPEELILTELLPQYREAPSSSLIKSGRGSEGGEYSDTISCISGFVVNMARRDVKLTTPVWSSKEHPTGEAILEKGSFKNAEEFRTLITGMISRHMANLIAPDDEVTFDDGLTFKRDFDKIEITSERGVIITVGINGQSETFDKMLELLSEGYRTRRDIVADTCISDDGKIIPPQLIHHILAKWWGQGLLKKKSGEL